MATVRDDKRVIVIGSGPAGAMAALTLLRQGIPVTMLESGQTPPRGLLVRAFRRTVYRKWPLFNDTGTYAPTDPPEPLWRHELAPGGMSNYWTGAVPRFAPDDFTEGERLHERYRWPVTYDDLRPYYERAERLLAISGGTTDVPQLPAGLVAYPCQLKADWRRIAPHALAAGHGLTPAPLADGSPWMLSTSAAPFNSYTGIVQQLHRYPHFQLILGAHALQLVWDGTRVRSVVYFDRQSSTERRIEGAAVVVAAGPLASTKLLLDSSSADFPTGLGDTDGILGRYLHDHAHDWCRIELDQPLSRLSHTVSLTRPPYAESEPLRTAFSTIGGNNTKLDKALAFTPLKINHFNVVTFGTVVPIEQNGVSLSPEQKDEFGLPKLDLHMRFDDDVRRTLSQARERVAAILERAGIHVRIFGEPPNPTPGASVHFGGTVRMHSSPRYGMLDAWNRLHAVENVAVVDASSFTTGVEKNPTLTVMALAARASERLAADLKVGAAASVHA